MILEDLLRVLRGYILNDRSDRVGGTTDELWPDDILITYINEAHRRFARLGLVLRDGTTPAVTQVTLVAGQRLYELHDSVIAVISGKVSTQEADLARVGHSLLGAYRSPSESWIDPAVYTALPPGAPLAFSTDEELTVDADGALASIMLRVYPTPRAEDAGKVIQLRVVRTPIVEFEEADLQKARTAQPSPEIARDHHLEMLDWAAYLALRIVDDDAGAPKRAAEFAQNFEVHVKRARDLVMRKLFTPQTWGFGRGGFTW